MAKSTDIKKEPTEVTVVYNAVTPCHFSHENKDYSLYHLQTYQLPDCPFVQSLIGQGLLIKK